MLAMLTKRALVLAEHGHFFSLSEFFDEPCFASGTEGGWKLAYPQGNATEAERDAQRARTPTFFPRGRSAHDDYIAARLNATMLDIEKWSPFKEALSKSDLNAVFPQNVIALHHLYWYDIVPLLATNPHYRSELEQCVGPTFRLRCNRTCDCDCDCDCDCNSCCPLRLLCCVHPPSHAHAAAPPPDSLLQVLARTGAAGRLVPIPL